MLPLYGNKINDQTHDRYWAIFLLETRCCTKTVECGAANLSGQGLFLSLVSLDIMHIWHLGFGRDLASSILLILLRSHVFHGSNATRLQEQLCIMCDVVDKFLLCVVVLTKVSICKGISCTYIYIFLYIYIHLSLCRLLS